MYVFTRLVIFLYWIGQYISATTQAYITESPVSVKALVGTNAQFHCAGTGNYLVWLVDKLTPSHPDILSRGITAVTLPSSGTVQSNLTVPATSENNGTTVRCAIGVSQFSLTAFSNYSTLTVLPGESAELNEFFIHTKSLIPFNFWEGNLVKHIMLFVMCLS